MSFESSFVVVNGNRLHYLELTGSKPNFLLIHGSSHCGGVWEPLAKSLAASGCRVVMPDLRGHGLSDKPEDSDYTWSDMQLDMAGLIGELDLDGLVLVGHSRGGGVSLLTAAVSKRVERAIVYEPTIPMPHAGAPRPQPNPQLRNRALQRRTRFASREALFEHYRTRETYRNWREDYLRAYIEHGARVLPDGSVELLCPTWVEAKLVEAIWNPGQCWDDIDRPELPLTVVFGLRGTRLLDSGRDPMAPARRLYPLAEVTYMYGASHYGPMERPEEFEEIVRNAVNGDG